MVGDGESSTAAGAGRRTHTHRCTIERCAGLTLIDSSSSVSSASKVVEVTPSRAKLARLMGVVVVLNTVTANVESSSHSPMYSSPRGNEKLKSPSTNALSPASTACARSVAWSKKTRTLSPSPNTESPWSGLRASGEDRECA